MTRISEENFTDGISRLGVLLRRRPERESEKLRTRHSRRAESRSCGCRRAARIRRMNRVPGGPTLRSMEPRPICRCARATSRACTAAHYFRPCCGVFRSHDQARAISFAGINLPDSGNQLAHQLGGVSPRARALPRVTRRCPGNGPVPSLPLARARGSDFRPGFQWSPSKLCADARSSSGRNRVAVNVRGV